MVCQINLSELFDLRNIEYNLCSQTFHLEQYIRLMVDLRLRSLRYFAPKIWNMIPAEIRALSLAYIQVCTFFYIAIEWTFINFKTFICFYWDKGICIYSKLADVALSFLTWLTASSVTEDWK